MHVRVYPGCGYESFTSDYNCFPKDGLFKHWLFRFQTQFVKEKVVEAKSLRVCQYEAVSISNAIICKYIKCLQNVISCL